MKNISLLFLTLCLLTLTLGDRAEEASVHLELLEMDLEDYCDKNANAQKNVLLRRPNAFKEKIETEKKYGSFVRTETEDLRTQFSVSDFGENAEKIRKWKILNHVGDTELPEESWNEIVTFKNTIEQLSEDLQIPCDNKTEKCTINAQGVRNILASSRNASELKAMWSAAQEIFLSSGKNYPNTLKYVSKAAEINGFTSPHLYWEMLVEYPDAYATAKSLWTEIEPLYKKLHEFVRVRLEQYYSGNDITKNIPVYLLGSEFGTDWSNIAPLVLPHRYLYDEITSMLNFQNIGGKQVYSIAEKFTTNMGLGKAGTSFWKNSIFNNSCPGHILTYCADRYSQIITCNKTGWTEYLNAHENMVRVTLNNLDYSTSTFNDFRISAFDEAIASISSILALKNLPMVGIVPEDVFLANENNQMSALLLTALRVLPRLPYYLLADTWRLQQLEEPLTNLSASWWEQRESIQRVRGATNNEFDFLGDLYIRSNKPYIGKFMGTILQFQLLEYFQDNGDESENILTRIAKEENFGLALKERAQKDWSTVVSENLYFDITSDALLEYFKPLEEYMENAPLTQVTQTVIPKTTTPKPTTTTTTQAPKTTTEQKPIQDEPAVEKKPNSPNLFQLPTFKPKPTVDSATVFKPTSRTTKEQPTTSSTGVWIGATIGVVSIAIIVVIVGKRKCKRRPATNNRRHEV